MQKLYSRKLIVLYGALVYLFARWFDAIEVIYLKRSCLSNPDTNYPIDSHVWIKRCFFDAGYVRKEALDCYDVPGYFRSFFPLDMAFPIVYSLLMLSILDLWEKTWGKKVLVLSIIVAALTDYLEDFCFAIFLKTNANIFAWLTAFFTTVKTCLLVINGICCILILLRWMIRSVAGVIKRD